LIQYASSLAEVMKVLANVLKGSGECAQINWRFLGLAMPAWVLIGATVLGAWGLWSNLRCQPPVLRF
jgi:disulfide bond formation protein DsbB